MDRTQLLARLAESRLEAAEDAKLPTHFPLVALLAIYYKSSLDCYIDYFAGFRALVGALGPIAIPTVPESFKVPDILASYTRTEMAKVIAGNDNYKAAAVISRAIAYLAITSIPGVSYG